MIYLLVWVHAITNHKRGFPNYMRVKTTFRHTRCTGSYLSEACLLLVKVEIPENVVTIWKLKLSFAYRYASTMNATSRSIIAPSLKMWLMGSSERWTMSLKGGPHIHFDIFIPLRATYQLKRTPNFTLQWTRDTEGIRSKHGMYLVVPYSHNHEVLGRIIVSTLPHAKGGAWI